MSTLIYDNPTAGVTIEENSSSLRVSFRSLQSVMTYSSLLTKEHCKCKSVDGKHVFVVSKVNSVALSVLDCMIGSPVTALYKRTQPPKLPGTNTLTMQTSPPEQAAILERERADRKRREELFRDIAEYVKRTAAYIVHPNTTVDDVFHALQRIDVMDTLRRYRDNPDNVLDLLDMPVWVSVGESGFMMDLNEAGVAVSAETLRDVAQENKLPYRHTSVHFVGSPLSNHVLSEDESAFATWVRMGGPEIQLVDKDEKAKPFTLPPVGIDPVTRDVVLPIIEKCYVENGGDIPSPKPTAKAVSLQPFVPGLTLPIPEMKASPVSKVACPIPKIQGTVLRSSQIGSKGHLHIPEMRVLPLYQPQSAPVPGLPKIYLIENKHIPNVYFFEDTRYRQLAVVKSGNDVRCIGKVTFHPTEDSEVPEVWCCPFTEIVLAKREHMQPLTESDIAFLKTNEIEYDDKLMKLPEPGKVSVIPVVELPNVYFPFELRYRSLAIVERVDERLVCVGKMTFALEPESDIPVNWVETLTEPNEDELAYLRKNDIDYHFKDLPAEPHLTITSRTCLPGLS